MQPILTLVKVLLSLASTIVQYMNNKKLMEAGAAQATLEGIKDAQAAILRANAARARGMSDDFRDPFDTDNK